MSPKDLVKQYLPSVNIMQLATCVDNQPWACSLHYYSDDDFNLYWISKPKSRHSQEIELNPNVAVTIKVYENETPKDTVIGVSFEGVAKLASESEVQNAAKGYQRKHHTDEAFLKEVVAGKNPYVFYTVKPTKVVLFDNKNFPDDPRQEWRVDT